LGWAALPVALAAGLAITGCGTPGAPLPPSLKLPDQVTDLSATRTGNQISLTWTMPKKNTEKLLLKGNVPVSCLGCLLRKNSSFNWLSIPEGRSGPRPVKLHPCHFAFYASG
jgi:hypothetical protein